MNKFTILILIFILAVATTACDTGTSTTTAGSEQTAQTAPAAAVEEEPAAVEPPALIERTVLFGNPMRFQGRLSPDGKLMSFRAPLDGVMNLWVGERGDFSSVRPITSDTGRGIPSHFWALDSTHVLYIQDQGGDENWHLYSVDLDSGETIDLTPFDGTQARMIAQSENSPGVAIVGMNDRDPKWHDVYRVDLATGERTLLAQNDGFASIDVDNDLQVRTAVKPLPDGGMQIQVLKEEGWEPLFDIPFEDAQTSGLLGFDAENEGVYMLDSRGRNTAALVHMNLADQATTVIAEADKADIASVLIDPRTHKPFAYAVDLIRPEWHAIHLEYTDTIEKLNQQLPGGSQVLAQSLDNRFWTVYTDDSDQSPVYKVFDAQTAELSELFVTNPELNDKTLAKMHGVVIPSRDGRTWFPT